MLQTNDTFLRVSEPQLPLNVGHCECPGAAEDQGRIGLSFLNLERSLALLLRVGISKGLQSLR